MTEKNRHCQLLQPMALNEFMANYWEKSPLHIERQNNNPFASDFSVDALERILSTNKLNFPQLQLTKTGESIPAEHYTDDNGLIVPTRVAEHFKQGSTIILSHAQRLHAPLMSLCRQVQKLLFMPCQTNLYYSPAGNRGFNPHYDTHDVFIVQVAGNKTFRFYSERTLFPTSANRFDKTKHRTGTQTEEVALSAGDTLYIPRGIVHDAVAEADDPSLHITLGVYPVLNRDLLHELIDVATESVQALRQSIPFEMWQESKSSTDSLNDLHTLMRNAMTEDTLHSALNQIRDRIALDATPDVLATVNKQSITSATSFTVRHDRIMHVEQQADHLCLRLFGSIIEFEPDTFETVKWVLSQSEIVRNDNVGTTQAANSVADGEWETVKPILTQLHELGIVDYH